MLTWWWHQPIEVKIANQCAPVLAGVKPSNMLILENKHVREVVRTLEGTGLSLRCLYAGSEQNIWLIYRKDELEKWVSQRAAMEFLQTCGYAEGELDRLLIRFGQRFRQYKNNKGVGFPHEMGVFLGYPMADVKGFVENEGRNYLYSGYWKVYENVEATKALFQTYEKVKNVFVEEAAKGKRLCQITMEWQLMTA